MIEILKKAELKILKISLAFCLKINSLKQCVKLVLPLHPQGRTRHVLVICKGCCHRLYLSSSPILGGVAEGRGGKGGIYRDKPRLPKQIQTTPAPP
jgi:hypothetical protein